MAMHSAHPDDPSPPNPTEPGWRRGSVGTARVWDEATRSARRAQETSTVTGRSHTTRPRVRRRSTWRQRRIQIAPEAIASPPVTSMTADQQALLQHLRSELPELDRLPGLRPLVERLVLSALHKSSRTGVSPDMKLLRRRAQKLVEALRSMRSEMQRVSQLTPTEEGISSVYRSVQGLASNASQAKAKRGMLEEIFRANLELHREAG